jgi:hypothetical protein
MPYIKQLTMQLELSFWSLAIRLLSESRLLRNALPFIYDLMGKRKFQTGLRMALFYSVSGFLVGLILGVLSIL